jgi:hypothetical protein
MNITGAKKDAVGKSLQRLEDNQIISRDTKTITGNGRANKRRVISLRKNYQEIILNGKNCNTEKSADAIRKNNCCNTEKQQIKDNKKIRENIIMMHLEETSSSKHINPSTARYY